MEEEGGGEFTTAADQRVCREPTRSTRGWGGGKTHQPAGPAEEGTT